MVKRIDIPQEETYVYVPALSVRDAKRLMELVEEAGGGRGEGDPWHSIYLKLEEAVQVDSELEYWPNEIVAVSTMEDAALCTEEDDGVFADRDQLCVAISLVDNDALAESILDGWSEKFYDHLKEAIA